MKVIEWYQIYNSIHIHISRSQDMEDALLVFGALGKVHSHWDDPFLLILTPNDMHEACNYLWNLDV